MAVSQLKRLTKTLTIKSEQVCHLLQISVVTDIHNVEHGIGDWLTFDTLASWVPWQPNFRQLFHASLAINIT